VNAIPSRVTAWIDVRGDTAEQIRGVLADLSNAGFPVVQESWTDATDLDAGLTSRVGSAIERASGLDVPVLATGAGHDAGVLAQAGIPSSMIFVRNPTGVSHSPAEYADPPDCEAGGRALAAVLADLCGAPPATRRVMEHAEPGEYRVADGPGRGSEL
jgi:beta-ureidopropionase / N-carbamoyl-L-amino-acid hydrolase